MDESPHRRKLLVLFSNPPDQTPLRLDKEDNLFSKISREHSEHIDVTRVHATDIDSIYSIVSAEPFDYLHISGHGNPHGVYLDRSDLDSDSGELVSADRLLSLLEIAVGNPKLLTCLCCYSSKYREKLSYAAPFVLTCDNQVKDDLCLHFVKGFYDSLCRNGGVQSAFEDAKRLLNVHGMTGDNIQLSRRASIRKGEKSLIECKPKLERADTILIDVSAVRDDYVKYGLSEEEFCHLLARKLRIHYWVFSVPRDRAIFPIGRLLFGEFSWKHAADIVLCSRIVKLQSDLPPKHWNLWATLLASYNDLASSEYRGLDNPASPINRRYLATACKLFTHQMSRHFKPSVEKLQSLGLMELIPHVEFAVSASERAVDQLTIEQFPQVVQALETCLTNLHEVVDGLQPPEDRD